MAEFGSFFFGDGTSLGGPSGPIADILMGRRSTMLPYMQSRAPQIPIDVVVLGDSWSAFGWQKGYTIPTLTYETQILPEASNITFLNCPGGMSTTDDPNNPVIEEGAQMNGIKGYTAKGGLIDALEEAGFFVANLWEFGQGGATMGPADITSGSWTTEMPQYLDAVGGTYGITQGPLPLYGSGRPGPRNGWSMWMQKQAWLQTPEHVGHPYRDWTACDAIAHPPTGRVLILYCGPWGNDIFSLGRVTPWIDMWEGGIDPTGAFADLHDEKAALDGSGGQLYDLVNAALNIAPPDTSEFAFASYTVMGLDDPLMNGNPSIPPRAAVDYSSPAEPDWIVNSTAENWWDVFSPSYPFGPAPVFVEHNPHTFTPNTADPNYEDPHVRPYDFKGHLAIHPGGQTGTTIPWTWGPTIPGFFKGYWAWGAFLYQRDITYTFLAAWWSHWIADQNAWQYHRGEPIAYYYWIPYTTYNYTLENTAWIGYGLGWGTPFPSRRWPAIYNHMGAQLQPGTINNTVLLTGGATINFHHMLTVLTKDFTTAKMTQLWRDMIHPRLEKAEEVLRGQGKKFTYLNVWDCLGEGDSSLDNPSLYPSGMKSYWVEGVHLSSYGNPIWCRAVVTSLFARSYLMAPYRPDLDITMSHTSVVEPYSGYSYVIQGGSLMLRYKGFLVPEYEDQADGPQLARMLVDSGPVAFFDDDTQRDDELTAPTEGWLAWRKDRRAMEVWSDFDGSWVDALRVAGSETWALQVTQNAVVIPTNNLEARYVRMGNLVFCWWDIRANGAGTNGQRIEHNLPFNPAGHSTGTSIIGNGTIVRGSSRYNCAVELTPTGRVLYSSDASNGVYVGQTPSFALATNDIIRGMAVYTVA